MSTLKHCMECGTIFDLEKPPCPHCGALPPQVATPTKAAPVPQDGSSTAALRPPQAPGDSAAVTTAPRLRWLGLAAAVVVIGGCLALADGDSDEGGGEYGARDVCEQFVKDRLKSPSTAKFSETSAAEVGGTWTVRGAVDSENGFGAKIRNTYTCEVRHDSGDKWKLIDLSSSAN